ncbi:1239_t:CDS:2, partial [Racocetra fulgida]
MSYQREYPFPSNQDDYFDNLPSYKSNNSFDIEECIGSSQDTIASEEFFAPLTNEEVNDTIQSNVNVNEIGQKLNSKSETSINNVKDQN